MRQVCYVRTEPNGCNFFYPVGDKHCGGVVGGDGAGVKRDTKEDETMCNECEGCVCDPTGCVVGIADVWCVSGGCDSGAKPCLCVL